MNIPIIDTLNIIKDYVIMKINLLGKQLYLKRQVSSSSPSVDDVYSILKCMHLENFFHPINNLHQNIKFTMEGERNGELAFLDTLLKQNNEEIPVLVYWKSTHTDQYLHYSSHHHTSCKESVVSSLFNRA